MKKLIAFSLIFLSVLAVKAQQPVTWTFSAKKIADKTYELHMTASIQSGWHLFSQTQPEDPIGIPTGIAFNNNPLLSLDGTIKEVGKMEKFRDTKLGLAANQYSSKVDFVQVVKLKGNVKTNVTGNVEFQTCNDERCMPPKTVNFSIALQ